jgi:hypothetical protein
MTAIKQKPKQSMRDAGSFYIFLPSNRWKQDKFALKAKRGVFAFRHPVE